MQFHRSHVARPLHNLGFSCQKPERRNLERDEEKIEEWKRSQWPRIKKHATRLGTLICTDKACERLSASTAPAHPFPAAVEITHVIANLRIEGTRCASILGGCLEPVDFAQSKSVPSLE